MRHSRPRVPLFYLGWIGLLLASLSFADRADARRGDPPHTSVGKTPSGIPVLSIEPPDVELLRVEDENAANDGSSPFRYAQPRRVAWGPDRDGWWESGPNGTSLWRAVVDAPGATDLNVAFERFRLPPGAKLWVISAEADSYEGPYTHEDNEEHGQLWVPVVPGSRATIELQVPIDPLFEPELELTQVGYGYRDIFGRDGTTKQGQGPCNNDVICPEGDPWRDQIASVVGYSLGGSIICSGQMVMDTAGSFRPYLLTAEHCGLNQSNAASVTVYWNFESPSCGLLSGGSGADNQTGAIFRASRSNSDFCLVELDDDPDPAFGVYYAGWDRSGQTPDATVGIHHPLGQEKAISFDDDPPSPVGLCFFSELDDFWSIEGWDDGATEPGSSGSGLFDADSGLLIGTLFGGYSTCEVAGPDCYGKFASAWDGPAPSRRLRDWLNPGGSAAVRVAGSYLEASAQPVVQSVTAIDQCLGSSDGVLAPGEAVAIEVELRALGGDLVDLAGTLSSTTPGVQVLQSTGSWPALPEGASASNATPFTVQLDSTVACYSSVAFELQLALSGVPQPFTMPFQLEVGLPLSAPGLPLAIPDGIYNGVTSTIEVTDDVLVDDLDVAVTMLHDRIGDLYLQLRSPAGTLVRLLNRPGYPATTTGCEANDMDIVFDDSASFNMENYCPPWDPWFVGRARAANLLSAFDGQSALGTWTLTVADRNGGELGILTDWNLVNDGVLLGDCSACSATSATVTASMRSANPVSVYMTLNGSGNPLGAAQSWDGVPGHAPTLVDATIDLEVLDAMGQPVAGVPASEFQLIAANGGVVDCAAPLIADGPTGADGMTTMGGTPFAGGFSNLPGDERALIHSPSGLTVTYANGVGLEIYFNSADINADGSIDLADIGEFASAALVSYGYYADFVWDGVIDLADIGEFALALNSEFCPLPASALRSMALATASRIDLSFDPDGERRTATLSPGEDLWAYVVLRGDLAARGIRAWEGAVRASDNVQLLEWVLPESSLNLREAPQFAVGLGDGSKAKAGDALQLAKVRVRVTDDAPAYLYLDSSEQPTRDALGAVALVGDDLRAFEPQTQPLAAINGEVDTPSTKPTVARIFNVPNPFNPATEIRFATPQVGRVGIRVYDLSGRLVRSFDRGVLSAGEHTIRWNGRDQNGAEVVSGVYFARLFVDGRPTGSPRKMSLLK